MCAQQDAGPKNAEWGVGEEIGLNKAQSQRMRRKNKIMTYKWN